MNANGLYNGLEGYIVPGTNSGMGNGVFNGVVNNDREPLSETLRLLDVNTGASVAYSLRKLSVNYNGPAIRVRRSSDNLEQDIYFDGNGNLSESGLISFVGANNGFVSIWYDQSGNSRNATQVTQSAQPRIVNSGVVDKKSGKTALFFDGIDDLLNGAGFSLTLSNFTSTCVFALISGSGLVYKVNIDPNRIYSPVIASGRFYLGYGGSATAIDVAASNTNLNVFSSFSEYNTTVYARLNGFNSVGISRNTSTITATNRLGAYQSGNSQFNGYIAEAITYPSEKSYISIESNINNYYKIY